MQIGVAADHGGFVLKGDIAGWLGAVGHDVIDFGEHALDPGGD